MNSKYYYIVILLFLLCFLSSCGGEIIMHGPEYNPGFWEIHGIFFLFFINFFPRLTILFCTPYPANFLTFLGWLFVPRILAAILATHYYWDTNPILCIITWIVAIGTTGAASGGTAKVASKE
ncbi:MAG: hypothetical protein Q8Q23_03360 [bacterium]|nr:hypothetical protein [bacterium]